MGVNGDLYKLLVVAHVLFAIGGFGSLAFNSVYLVRGRQRGGAGQVGIVEANYDVSRLAEYLIYAVAILGMALVSISKTDGVEVWKFSQAWVILALVAVVAVVGLLHGLIRPSQRRYRFLLAEVNSTSGKGRPEAAGELEAVERRIALAWAGFNLIVVAVIYLMVFQPGS